MSSEKSFSAWRVDETENGTFVGIEQKCGGKGPSQHENASSVLIKVTHSSLNYKDALSASGNKGITRSFPHTPGIDAAGTMLIAGEEENAPADFQMSALVTGYVRKKRFVATAIV